MCQKMMSKMGPRPTSRLCWPGPAPQICRYTIPDRGEISIARSKTPCSSRREMLSRTHSLWQAELTHTFCRGLDPHSKPCQATDIGAIPRVLRVVCARDSCGQWPYQDHPQSPLSLLSAVPQDLLVLKFFNSTIYFENY